MPLIWDFHKFILYKEIAIFSRTELNRLCVHALITSYLSWSELHCFLGMRVHSRLHIYSLCGIFYLPWHRTPGTNAIRPGWNYSRQHTSARGHTPSQLPTEYTGVLPRGAHTYCRDQNSNHGPVALQVHALSLSYVPSRYCATVSSLVN